MCMVNILNEWTTNWCVDLITGIGGCTDGFRFDCHNTHTHKHKHRLISDWLFPFNRATVITCILCVSYLSSPRPSSAVRLFYFPDGRYFAKIMCIRCYNNETVTRRPLSSVQPLSTIVEAHVNIHNFSMIRSMFRPLLRWLLLLNIAFNEYDFLEKHGHLLLLPFDYWLIEKMRARSFSFSFQFKHWISQTVIQVLFALPIESTGASIFQHSIEMHQ